MRREQLILDNLWLADRLVNRFSMSDRTLTKTEQEDLKQEIRLDICKSVDLYLKSERNGSNAILDIQEAICRNAKSRLVRLTGNWHDYMGTLILVDDVVGYADREMDPERKRLQTAADKRARLSRQELDRAPSLNPQPDGPLEITDGVGATQVMAYAVCSKSVECQDICCAKANVGHKPHVGARIRIKARPLNHRFHVLEARERKINRDRVVKIRTGFEAMRERMTDNAIPA